MKKKILFYVPKDTLNEATIYYCKFIEEVLLEMDYIVEWIDNPKLISKDVGVLTIRSADLVRIKKKPKFFINWFQGIGPEEYKLLHPNFFRNILMYHYLSFYEKKALKRTDLCFFVSNAMLRHYERKYNLKLSHKSIIIPCYNKHLDLKSFDIEDKYDTPKFVYAGGLFAWQCIDETLLTFKEIYKLNNKATLTLLTGQQKEAESLIKKYSLQNVFVNYVSLNRLSEELSKYKYGFLIRQNHIVNNVSTPTKMNSYMASGIIPIYTNVVDSFEENIDLEEYSLKIDINDSYKKNAEKIIQFDAKEINVDKLKNIYLKIFKGYYSDSQSRKLILEKIKIFNGL